MRSFREVTSILSRAIGIVCVKTCRIGFSIIVAVICVVVTFGQLARVVVPLPDDPLIGYSGPSRDPVATVNRDLETGKAQLKFNGESGYLRSVLDALNVPVESQMAVFSRTSVQGGRISPQNPRTLFFNDSVVVGWVRGGFIELAAEDPQQGVIFYELDQQRISSPKFARQDGCLGCHATADAASAPGMIVRSHFVDAYGTVLRQLGFFDSDHRSPLAERWGGWYVTGNTGTTPHLGNVMVSDPERPKAGQALNLESLADRFDTNAYLTPYSDVVALMVFEHQMHMVNLLTRMGWQTRYALSQKGAKQQMPTDLNAGLADTARELVDYMLFVDEAPLTNRIRGTSGFSETFAAGLPRDSQGRSLRQLDLERRLMKYPCSYMIYSPAFDALPSEAKEMIYRRMWQVLSGQIRGGKYNRLSSADRQAIVGILRETKTGLPTYFQPIP